MISLAEIIDPIEQLYRDTPNEGKRVDLNTPLIEMGLSVKDVAVLIKAIEIGTRSKFNLEETGFTVEDISKLHVMQFWNFCQQHMKQKNEMEPQPLKKVRKKRWGLFAMMILITLGEVYVS